jgi:hypothetical protein
MTMKDLKTNLIYQGLIAASTLTALVTVVVAGKKW